MIQVSEESAVNMKRTQAQMTTAKRNIIMKKRYELIFTIVKYGDDRDDANEQVEYVHKLLEEHEEDYSFSTYCTG